MILTSILQELNLDIYVSKIIRPLFLPFPSISELGRYCIFIGLLCGFPLGAKTIVDQYENNKLSKEEAQLLLPFCNQFSPIFYISVVCPIIFLIDSDMTLLTLLLFIYTPAFMYLIYHQYLSDHKNWPTNTSLLKQSDFKKISIAKALDLSLTKNILPIIKIGSYMIIFRVCNCIPKIIVSLVNSFLLNHSIQNKMIAPLLQLFYLNSVMSLEITTGIMNLSHKCSLSINFLLFLVLFRLHTGGLSCLMQTYAFLEDTDLSIVKYYKTKILFGFISIILIALYFIFKNLTI